MMEQRRQLRPSTNDGRSLPCTQCGISTPDSHFTFCCANPMCDNCADRHGFCDRGEDDADNPDHH